MNKHQNFKKPKNIEKWSDCYKIWGFSMFFNRQITLQNFSKIGDGQIFSWAAWREVTYLWKNFNTQCMYFTLGMYNDSSTVESVDFSANLPVLLNLKFFQWDPFDILAALRVVLRMYENLPWFAISSILDIFNQRTLQLSSSMLFMNQLYFFYLQLLIRSFNT